MTLPIFPTRIERTAPPTAPQGWPLLRLGFRPFYLCAALYACLAVPVWAGVWLGLWQPPLAVAPLLWHAHDMLFGFAVAVIVGFLLTAGRAWTGLDTPRGAPLAALVLLWLAARVAAVSGPYGLYAVLDLALLPIVAVILLRLLLRAGNRRNLLLVGLLGLLAVANGGFHLAMLGVLVVPAMTFLHAGLALVVMVECVMAARVVPAFTMSATPGLRIPPRPRLDAWTLGVTALALAAWVAEAPAVASAALAALAAVLLAVRQAGWRPGATRHRPILWILHAACAWLPVGLALLAAAQLGVVAASAGVHALAVGATGGLVIGMVTRTARGHTGRPLLVGRAEVAAYGMVMAAALLRVALPIVPVASASFTLGAAALLWAAAFAVYLIVHAPWLLAPRADGMPG
jgi:uncharacterized protein involved in response to NO